MPGPLLFASPMLVKLKMPRPVIGPRPSNHALRVCPNYQLRLMRKAGASMVVPAHEGAPWFCPEGKILQMLIPIGVVSECIIGTTVYIVARGMLTGSQPSSRRRQNWCMSVPSLRFAQVSAPPLVRLGRSRSDSLPSCTALGFSLICPTSFGDNCCGLTQTASSIRLRRAPLATCTDGKEADERFEEYVQEIESFGTTPNEV